MYCRCKDPQLYLCFERMELGFGFKVSCFGGVIVKKYFSKYGTLQSIYSKLFQGLSSNFITFVTCQYNIFNQNTNILWLCKHVDLPVIHSFMRTLTPFVNDFLVILNITQGKWELAYYYVIQQLDE